MIQVDFNDFHCYQSLKPDHIMMLRMQNQSDATKFGEYGSMFKLGLNFVHLLILQILIENCIIFLNLLIKRHLFHRCRHVRNVQSYTVPDVSQRSI